MSNPETTRRREPIVDWQRVDTVLLDLDGTVLDLHFDNRFWREHLPLRFGQARGLDPESARAMLAPVFADNAGSLNWYCTDFWARRTQLDIMALKHELAHLIAPLPGALGFLDALAAAGLPAWIVTNAHPDVVDLKMRRTGLRNRFVGVVTSHEMKYAKEESAFWPALSERIGFDRQRSLFVDDSPAVVSAAANYAIGQVVALTRPDSRGAVRAHDHRPAVARLASLPLPLASLSG